MAVNQICGWLDIWREAFNYIYVPKNMPYFITYLIEVELVMYRLINQQLDVLLFISSSSKIHILQFMEQTNCCVSGFFFWGGWFFLLLLLFYPLFCTPLNRSVSIYSVALKFFQRMICKMDKISFFFYFHFITYLRYNFPAYY